MRHPASIIIVAMLALIACQSAVFNGSADNGGDARIFSMGFIEKIDSLNPFLGLYDAAYVYYGLVYDYLMIADKDLNLAPNIASSWWTLDGPTAASLGHDFSSDYFPKFPDPADWPFGSIWEFNLTDNVFWSDGERLTAYDVEWTYNIQKGVNFAMFWAFQPATRWIHHAEAVDDHKIRVFFAMLETGEPFPAAFGGGGVGCIIPILPKHALEDKSPAELSFDWDGTPVICTGAFTGTDKIMEEMIEGERIKLVKNPFYDFIDDDGSRRGLGAIYNRTVEIDELHIKFFGDENVLQLGVLTGEIDATEIEPTTYLTWEDPDYDRPEWLETVKLFSCTGYTKSMAINAHPDAPAETTNPLRLDPAVRRAMTIMVNRSYIVDNLFNGFGIPGTSIINSPAWGEWFWEPGDDTSWFNVTDGSGNIIENASYSKPLKDVMGYDPVLANKILNESGYDQWTGGEFGKGIRKAGNLAAERMNYLYGSPQSSILDRTLEFEILTTFDNNDRRIAEYVIKEWEKIGVSSSNRHVNYPTWAQDIYNYVYEVSMTYWSGDIDPNYLCYITTSLSINGWNDFGTMDEEYDGYYIKQATSMNFTERKYYVDKCIEWHYLSGQVVTTIVPEICFAFSNERWTNWGDWEAHPGLAIDHFWSEAPFTYHVQYVGEPHRDTPLWVYIAAIGIIAVVAFAISYNRIRRKSIEKKFEKEFEDEESLDEEKVNETQ